MQGLNIGIGYVAQKVGLYILNIFCILAVNVAGDVEVKLVGFNLCYRHNAAVFFKLDLLVEDIHYLVYVLLAQAVLVAIFLKAFAVFSIFLI